MKPLKGYEGLYSVNKQGQVFSHRRNRFLKPQLDGGKNKGKKIRCEYYYVNLCNKGENKTHKIARLVAETFIDNFENLPIVDHINRNCLDDRVENLRWCTFAQNQQNRAKKAKASSKYKGVYFYKKFKRFEARAHIQGTSLYLGRFKDEKDAARAWNEHAKEKYGEFAVLNDV